MIEARMHPRPGSITTLIALSMWLWLGSAARSGHGGRPWLKRVSSRTFLCRNLGGSMGSTGMSCILMMRWLAPLLYCAPCCAGVYLM